MIVTGAVIWGADHPKQAAAVGAGLFLLWRYWQRRQLIQFFSGGKGVGTRNPLEIDGMNGWEARHQLVTQQGLTQQDVVADLLPWYGISTWKGAVEKAV